MVKKRPKEYAKNKTLPCLPDLFSRYFQLRHRVPPVLLAHPHFPLRLSSHHNFPIPSQRPARYPNRRIPSWTLLRGSAHRQLGRSARKKICLLSYPQRNLPRKPSYNLRSCHQSLLPTDLQPTFYRLFFGQPDPLPCNPYRPKRNSQSAS